MRGKMNKKAIIWILSLLILVSFSNAALSDDVVQSYLFDTDATDDVGGLDWTVSGATLTAGSGGYIGEAYNYDGSNDDLSRSGSTYDSFTFGAWVYIDALTSSRQVIYNGRSSGSNTDYIEFLILATTDTHSNQLRLTIQADGNGYRTITGTTNMPTGTWTYTSFTYNHVTGSTTIWVNGVKETIVSTTGSTSGSVSTTFDEFLGEGFGSVSNLDGKIDEVVFWDDILSDADLLDVYEKYSVDGLQYPWEPDAGNISIIAKDYWDDSTINSFNVTVNGTGYSYDFTTINGTIDTNISVNASVLVNISLRPNNYFARNFNDVNLSINPQLKAWQSEITINATEILTGNQISGNATIESTINTTGVGIFLIKAGTYNVTIDAGGYFSKTSQIVIPALSTSTYTVENMSNAILNLTLVNQLTGQAITNFTAQNNVTADETTTNGYLEYQLYSGLFNITVFGDQFNTQSEIINLSTGITNYTINVTTLNSVNFTIKDETTLSTVTTNMTITVVSEYLSREVTTINGLFDLELLVPDEYEIRYYSTNTDDYKLRSLFVGVSNNSYQQINLYALNTSDDINNDVDSVNVVFRVIDQNFQVVENAKVILGRYYTSSSGYVDIWSKYTDVNGESAGIFEEIDAFYQYRVLVDGVLKEISSSNGIQLLDSDSNGEIIFNIFINTQDNFLDTVKGLENISRSLTFTNTTNSTGYFSFIASSSSAYEFCLDVQKISSIPYSNTTCITSANPTIIQYITSSNRVSYIATGTVTFSDGTKYTISNLEIQLGDNPIDDQDIANYFNVIVAMLSIATGIAFLAQPEIGIILQGLVLLIAGSIGFNLGIGIIGISISAGVTLIMIALFIGGMVKKE